MTALIGAIHRTFAEIQQGGRGTAGPDPGRFRVNKSIQPDYLICLEDGRKLKMLKRHLRTTYDMTPEDYRAKWGLPVDYPMVAPNYAKQRSAFAKEIGLGRKSRRPRKRK